MSKRALEIEAVATWYEQEGKKPLYWTTSPYPDEQWPTRARITLGEDVRSLIGYLEHDDMGMAYHVANGLHVDIAQLTKNSLGPGMCAHIARTRYHR